MNTDILGFILVNGYAFLMILFTVILFFSKPRLGKIEDTIYTNFLITNLCMVVSGIILGIIVAPGSILAILFNKIYLICLFLWIFLFTFYVLYVSIKDNMKILLFRNIFTVILVISLLIILMLPINIKTLDGGSALAVGGPVTYTYIMFGLGFIVQIICVLFNFKNIKNKKYTPVYVLIVLGLLILLIQVIYPDTNYLINPVLVFVAVIMYHTIENPDIKIIEELKKSQEVSNSSNMEKSMFLFDVTQNVKQPVSKIHDISTYIESSNDIGEIKELVKEIKASSQSIYNTINSVLDVSAIESSKLDVKYNKYNLSRLLKEITKIAENNNINENVKLNINISKDIPDELYGDSIRLKQALSIVVNNAFKYTTLGNVSFTTNSVLKGDICRLVITVEDTGCGIHSEELEKILKQTKALTAKELDKMDESNKHLAMAKTLISLIGGTMIIDSKVDVGTKVTIVLDQKIVETDSKLSKYIDKLKVLVVDDNINDLEKLKKKLYNYDINVVVSKSGESCLVKNRKNEHFDLILMKEEMEKLDGISTFKKLKMIDNFDIPVVIMTKEKEEITLNAFKSLGFKDYLLLPVKQKDIDIIINKYLDI